jgi:hypothetical protein
MRHVPPARQRKDEDGNVLGFLPQAFLLKPDEPYLSAAWVEHATTGQRSTDILATIVAFKGALTCRKNDRFAVGNVGVIKATCSTFKQSVRISHEPVVGFDAHVSVRQFQSDNDQLLDLLAAEAWAEMCGPAG